MLEYIDFVSVRYLISRTLLYFVYKYAIYKTWIGPPELCKVSSAQSPQWYVAWTDGTTSFCFILDMVPLRLLVLLSCSLNCWLSLELTAHDDPLAQEGN
jgi:hypothetical protein